MRHGTIKEDYEQRPFTGKKLAGFQEVKRDSKTITIGDETYYIMEEDNG